MPSSFGRKSGVLIAGVIVLAAGVGAFAVWRHDFTGSKGGRLPAAFQYDARLKKTDPAQILYRESASFSVPLKEPRAVAVGLQDQILVAGEKLVVVYDSGGGKVREVTLSGEPQAVAVGPERHDNPGQIYVALKDHVEVYDLKGKKVAAWGDLGSEALFTSITVAEHEILVADAGHRVVYRYDPAGKLLGQINGRDPTVTNQLGFVVPSPHFDVAVAADEMVNVVNPGKRCIERYAADGHLVDSWGRQGDSLEDFCGCCNPVALAILPDQRLVTAEKGIPRVKVYSREGKFVGVVAGWESFAPNAASIEETREKYRLPVLDVAADSQGRVLVLDPSVGKVRIFERVKEAK